MERKVTEKKKESRFKQALIGTIVALIFSPLGIVLGYFLNDYLARDKIVIKGAELVPVLETYNFNIQELREISRSKVYSDFEDEGFSSYSSILHQVFSSEYSLEPKYLKSFLNELDKFLFYCKEYHEVLGEVNSYIYGNKDRFELPMSISGYHSISSILIFFDSKKIQPEDKEDIVKGLIMLSEELTTVESYILEFKDRISNFKPKRTGKLNIRVILVNKGNTDGLISGNGKLLMTDEQKILDIIAIDKSVETDYYYNTVKYASVPKRSMINLYFTIDELNNNISSLSTLKGALVNTTLR